MQAAFLTPGKLCLGLAAFCLPALGAGLVFAAPAVWQPAAVALSVALAIGLGRVAALRGYRYTLWIVAAVTAALIYPAAFRHWGPIDLAHRWLLLAVIQLVMFGMGTQMHLQGLAGVARMPRRVLVGVAGQFTIMPLVGYGLTKVFTFPPEVAAGVVLIGSCSSGLASNVMNYLAGGDLALSITLTTCSTLLAPVMTPLWMRLLAGEYLQVNFLTMMMETIKIVFTPVGAAPLHDYLRRASPRGRRTVLATAVVGVVYLAFLGLGGWRVVSRGLAGTPPVQAVLDPALTLAGFLLGGVLVAVVYHALTRRWGTLDRAMPVASMFGIMYFTAVTTAAGRDNLLAVGGLLFLTAVLHNTFGYLFGYLLSRACRLDRKTARTIALEVGLQNGGMAAGIAGSMQKLGTVGLAAAIFSPWMNVSGSLLANYWRKRPIREGGADRAPRPGGRREFEIPSEVTAHPDETVVANPDLEK